MDGDRDCELEDPSWPIPDTDVDDSIGLAADTDVCVKLGDEEA